MQVEREASIVYKPHRLPAWCDRILWHSNMPQGMHPLCSGYFMVAEADSSDHKPVGAVFTLPAVLSPAQVVSDSIESAPPPHPRSADALYLLLLAFALGRTGVRCGLVRSALCDFEACIGVLAAPA